MALRVDGRVGVGERSQPTSEPRPNTARHAAAAAFNTAIIAAAATSDFKNGDAGQPTAMGRPLVGFQLVWRLAPTVLPHA